MADAKIRHLSSDRRLAAIMFTDIVGYTKMMSEDEQKTLSLLRINRETHKKLIFQFGGKFLKEMGDGILASFENSSDAVICAAAIQKESIESNIELRVGIHMGEVTFENDDIFGDGVNIASRIQPLAEPGQILISETVQNNVQNKPGITTHLIGEKDLKNVAKAKVIYVVDVHDDFLTPGARTEKKKSAAPMIIGIASIVVVVFTIAGYWFGLASQDPPPAAPVIRYDIDMKGGLWRTGRTALAFSQDGKYICYLSDGQLFLKSLNEAGSGRVIPGSWDPRGPTFSPDGDWIAFEDVSTGTLVKVSITGGNTQVLSQTGRIQGLHWARNELIFSWNAAFYKINEKGGTPEKIYPLDTAKFAQSVSNPMLLPDGKTILYSQHNGTDWEVWKAEPGKNQAAELLVDNGFDARYLEGGYLSYLENQSLHIVKFDSKTNRILGSPHLLTSDPIDISWGIGQYAISDRGTLVYAAGTGDGRADERNLVWVDLNRKIEKISKQSSMLMSPRLSPDGNQIIVDVETGVGSFDMMTYSPQLGTATKFSTSDSTVSPTWAPDNNTIAYFQLGQQRGVYARPLDNSYPERLLFESDDIVILGNWSGDGRYLVFSSAGDIGYFDFADSTVKYLDFINAETEFLPRLSPDGKWLSYCSDDNMDDHVYVVPFPGPGRAHRISVEEGFASVWAPDMQAIYFVGLNDNGVHMFKADIEINPEFSSSEPVALFYGEFTTQYRFASTNTYELGNSGLFDIHPDGNRFLMHQSIYEENTTNLIDAPKLNVVVNWQELMKGQ